MNWNEGGWFIAFMYNWKFRMHATCKCAYSRSRTNKFSSNCMSFRFISKGHINVCMTYNGQRSIFILLCHTMTIRWNNVKYRMQLIKLLYTKLVNCFTNIWWYRSTKMNNKNRLNNALTQIRKYTSAFNEYETDRRSFGYNWLLFFFASFSIYFFFRLALSSSHYWLTCESVHFDNK